MSEIIHQLKKVKDDVVLSVNDLASANRHYSNKIAVDHPELIQGIGDSFQRTANTEKMLILHAAMAFDTGKIEARFVRDHGKDVSIANSLAVELKRFLALSALNPTRCYEMAGPVDDMWHVFLLFTREYRSFCELFGENFHIDHVPADRTSFIGVDSGYARFIEDYEGVFGPPNVAFWPQIHRVGFRVISSSSENVVSG